MILLPFNLLQTIFLLHFGTSERSSFSADLRTTNTHTKPYLQAHTIQLIHTFILEFYPKMVQLSTSDNEVFTVERDIAERSVLIKTMLDDLGDSEEHPIPLTNVSSNVLKKVSNDPCCD